MFFLLIDKFNLCLIYILQYLLQLLLDIHYYIERLYIVSNILFKLLAFKNKYNKNKLLILDKINNFVINVLIIIKLVRQTFKKKLNLID